MRAPYLNAKEAAVYHAFPAPGRGEKRGEFVDITTLAGKAFAKKGTSSLTKGNSWVRNSLRKLLRLGLVAHSGPKSGKYARTSLPPPEAPK